MQVGSVAFSRRTASSKAGKSRAISAGRLPGRTSRIGSSARRADLLAQPGRIAPWRSRAPGRSCRRRSPAGPPPRTTARRTRGSTADGPRPAASVFARPGRDAQTCGPTYLTSGSSGSSRRSRCATRRVNPQQSISTATSGFSRAASAAVSSARAQHARIGQQALDQAQDGELGDIERALRPPPPPSARRRRRRSARPRPAAPAAPAPARPSDRRPRPRPPPA